ncbi:MAG: branched-chain amino acid ABC transporter permease [Bacteroidetes bacterium]|nr:branched-chain amino acid ABC transporter permease [Bacteroidota bacterium]
MLWDYLQNGLVNGSTITIMALGFALVYNTFRVFHIAYAGLFTLAAYTFLFLTANFHLSVAVAMILSIIPVALLSWLIDFVVYNPVSRKGNDPNLLMIASVGVFIVITNLLGLVFGNQPRIIPESLRTSWMDIRLMIFFIQTLLIIVFAIFLKSTVTGLMLRAVRDEPRLSMNLGIPAARMRSLVFILSGTLVAVAGSLQCLDVGVNPYSGLPLFISAFIAMVIGGVGRYEGAVLGGFLLGLIQSFTEYFTGSQWVVVITFVVLLVFLFIRPEGIIPEKQRGV